jgi:hypothetical protein
MNDQNLQAEKTRGSSLRLDRRNALKAGVALGVGWSAPALTSSPVSAAATCTPSCAPPAAQQPQVNVTLFRSCDDVRQVRVWTLTDVSLGSVINCPCGGTTTLELLAPALGTVMATVPYSTVGTLVLDTPVLVSIQCAGGLDQPVSRLCDLITTTNSYYQDPGCTEGAISISTSTPCPGGPVCV